MAETSIEPALSYLYPVDFMHVIEISKYLYEKYQSKIQEKRKESLVRFTDCDDMEDLCYISMFRSTKLPNGQVEGKYEMLDRSYYNVQNYTNGKQVGYRFMYNYLQYEGKWVSEENRRSFITDMARRFKNWEDIDVSKMYLVVRIGTATDGLDK